MRTFVASGIAAGALGLLLLGLALRSAPMVLLALPLIIVLAIGSLSPPPQPAVVALRSLSHERIAVGADADVELLLRNEGPSIDLVEVADVLPREFSVVRGTNHAVASLEAGETLHLAYAVRSEVKGDFRLGPVRARAFDPLGLNAKDAVADVVSRLVVAPGMEDLRRVAIRPRQTRPWFGQVPSRRIGASTEFWGVREYAPGDEVRRINWKASARLDRLFSNEYEGERTADVVIVVDARREALVGTDADNPVEHGVRAALGIADRALAAKNRAGLIVQREVLDVVPLAFGRKQLFRILDHLIHVSPGGEWPITHVASVLTRFFPRDCLVVLITSLQDRSAVVAVTGLLARGYDVAIVSPSALAVEGRHRGESEENRISRRILGMERANLIAQLARVAPVVDWDPATPLVLALRRMSPRPNLG